MKYILNVTDDWIRELSKERSTIKCHIYSRDKCWKLDDWKKNHRLYFLIWFNNWNLTFYVGQSKNIKNRLSNHNKNKNFWKEVIVFTDNWDEKGFIKYIDELENYFIELIDKSSYHIENENKIYNKEVLSEDEQELVKEIENYLIALWYNFKNENINNQISLIEETEKFIWKNNNYYFEINKNLDNRWYCKAIITYEKWKFKILKWSIGAKILTPSSYTNWKWKVFKDREKLIQNGIIREYSDRIEFLEDYIFNKSSSITSILIWNPSNWKDHWIDMEGKKLSYYYENKLL